MIRHIGLFFNKLLVSFSLIFKYFLSLESFKLDMSIFYLSFMLTFHV
ncbi:hypothetical protein HMPREF3189_00977 [Clostridiales bacterium KA00134]|nr:hypothetical protein HMPREF3189_00977 [Clostridiales bacterium KA00134]